MTFSVSSNIFFAPGSLPCKPSGSPIILLPLLTGLMIFGFSQNQLAQIASKTIVMFQFSVGAALLCADGTTVLGELQTTTCSDKFLRPAPKSKI